MTGCRHKHQLLLNIFENFTQGLICADAGGIIHLINDRAQKILQAEAVNLEGLHLSCLPNPELAQYMTDALKREIPYQGISVENTMEPGGQRITLNITPVTGPDNSLQGVIGVIGMSNHLSQATAFVLDTMKAGVIIIDHRERLIYFSPYCEILLGLKNRDIIGRQYTEVFHMIPPEEQYTVLTLRTGHEYRNLEHEHFAHPGRFLLTDTNLLRNSMGQVVGAVGYFKDITDLKQAHREHEEYIKLSIINQIAAGMAHEIRNPLTSVKGFVQMALSGFNVNDTTHREFGGIVMLDIERIEHLITCFLHLAEPSKPRLLPVNISVLAHHVAEQARQSLRYNNISLLYTAGPEPLLINGDVQQLTTLVQTLLFNAADFTPPGGTVTVTISTCPKQRIDLVITNTGEVMSSKSTDEIFNPFGNCRVSPVSLAMSVVKKLVELHGGNISVKNTPGQGTEVRCTFFPYQQDDSSPSKGLSSV